MDWNGRYFNEAEEAQDQVEGFKRLVEKLDREGMNRLSYSLVHLIMENGARIAASTSPLDCRAECNEENPSPLCEVTKYPKGSREPLLKLQARLRGASPKPVSFSELLTMFAQTKGDCVRGNTVVENGRLSNFGMPCDISTQLEELRVKATIRIPARLIGLVTQSANELSVFFPDDAQAASLEVEDANLNERFGGVIRSVDADSTTIRFGMPHACLAISASN